jgi:antitoxin VapB
MRMALSIRNKRAEAVARQVAEATGESLTDAILHSLEDRLARLQAGRTQSDLANQLMDIGRRCAAMPCLDTRPADDIIGYRQDGTVG